MDLLSCHVMGVIFNGHGCKRFLQTKEKRKGKQLKVFNPQQTSFARSEPILG